MQLRRTIIPSGVNTAGSWREDRLGSGSAVSISAANTNSVDVDGTDHAAEDDVSLDVDDGTDEGTRRGEIHTYWAR